MIITMARNGLRSRAGFGLLEVLVALALGGMVVLGARALLVQLADGAERIAAFGVEHDRVANSERFLRRLLEQVEPGDGVSAGFVGDEQAVRFSTWCEVPAGWQQRCVVTLGFIHRGQGRALVALLPDSEVIVLREDIPDGAFRYLHSAAAGGTWLHSWQSTVTTPLALGVITNADTLIVRIAERG